MTEYTTPTYTRKLPFDKIQTAGMGDYEKGYEGDESNAVK